ncbi:hypothetical protein L210DRAFT_3400461 [Boletus edulis BED1]|uniref:HAT C-terminal dimerisation domain-containing protein n=1 Tax=Boletus edulis BED1 TaxID=1328754 RepID=A0AAD4BV30_BOLED|nr:hypothetical protein L210DRAFT_3400461 [Boletus edulis BED1]
MLILDVKTWRSSTHQMLRRAMDYHSVIDDFVAKNRELRKHELQDEDWKAIALVAHWLKLFQSATTQMSTTKHPMLSWTHAIFRGLQDSLADSLSSLPNNIPTPLRHGLLNAHWKLSDYYGKSDASPYYTWASLLDPRISYCGFLTDCGDDLDACAHLKASKECFHAHFCAKYDKQLPPTSAPIIPTSTMNTSPQKITTDFFLHLLISPLLGSAVAVEWIFSGSHNTISLHRASLNPETIRTLMLVKQQLHLARTTLSK